MTYITLAVVAVALLIVGYRASVRAERNQYETDRINWKRAKDIHVHGSSPLNVK